MNIKQIFRVLITSLFTLTMIASAARAEQLPPEPEMRAYLKVFAEANFSCTYVPLHYIDLSRTNHAIKNVTLDGDNGYFFRPFTDGEIKYLRNLVAQQPGFVITRADAYGFYFSVQPGTSERQVLEGIYRIKRILDEARTGLFIQSQGFCAGTVSVGN